MMKVSLLKNLFTYAFLKMVTPRMSISIQNPRKIKKRIFAIEAAPAAIPVKPNTAAIIAIAKKRNDQRNIVLIFSVNKSFRI
jgi:hypothetical protein